MSSEIPQSTTPTQLERTIARQSPAQSHVARPLDRLLSMKYCWVWLGIGLSASIATGFWLHQRWNDSLLNTLAFECRESSEQAQWDRLDSSAKRWSMIEPGRAEPWLFRAEAAEAKKNWNVVVDCLAQVPHDDRRAVASLARKASLEFESLNRPWDGIRTCDEILLLEPRVLLAHKQPVFFMAMTLQRTELVRRIRAAIRVGRESPDSYVYMASASWFYGSSLYRHNAHWLQSDPESEIFLVARAMQVYMSEAKTNLKEAANYKHIPPAEELLKRFPHNLELLSYLLEQAMSDGDLSRVEQLLEAVPIESGDHDARIWSARAWRADSSGDLASAADDLQRAFAIDPYWWKVHYQLYDVYRRMERTEESERFLRIYEVSFPLGKMIMDVNRSAEAFDDLKFRTKLLELAELVRDTEVIAALRERFALR